MHRGASASGNQANSSNMERSNTTSKFNQSMALVSAAVQLVNDQLRELCQRIDWGGSYLLSNRLVPTA